jgi:CRP-like cAMP-binding protein
MGPGQYFGEIELVHGGSNRATIRAGLDGVDLAVLDDRAFNAILSESPDTRREVESVVQERLRENIAARRTDNAH